MHAPACLAECSQQQQQQQGQKDLAFCAGLSGAWALVLHFGGPSQDLPQDWAFCAGLSGAWALVLLRNHCFVTTDSHICPDCFVTTDSRIFLDCR